MRCFLCCLIIWFLLIVLFTYCCIFTYVFAFYSGLLLFGPERFLVIFIVLVSFAVTSAAVNSNVWVVQTERNEVHARREVSSGGDGGRWDGQGQCWNIHCAQGICSFQVAKCNVGGSIEI